ncbi:MAG: hypothetical protein HPY57_12635 [Ignavibacteria bacterium]|nr:hypothetical protein [Ignavibacteria bacterium]
MEITIPLEKKLKYNLDLEHLVLLSILVDNNKLNLKLFDNYLTYHYNRAKYINLVMDLESLNLVKIIGDLYDDDLNPLLSSILVRAEGLKIFQDQLEATKIEELAKELRDLFPSGIKSGGYYVKGNLKDIKYKLVKFIKKYPKYDKDIIIKATKNYIDRKRAENWNMIKTIENFILKDNTSVLASECENLLENGDEPDDLWMRNIV